MTSILGQLAVNLLARTSKFESGMRRSSNRVKGLQADVGRLGGAIGAVGGIAAGVVSARTFSVILNQMDELGKASDRLDFSTQRLFAYHAAAQLAGVSVQEFNKGMERMQVSLADADSGMKSARDAFERLGLTTANLRKLRPEDQFMTIGQAIDGMANNADKLQALDDIFGRSGRVMATMLPTLKETTAEFEKLGITREQARSAEEFNDMMTSGWIKLTARMAQGLGVLQDWNKEWKQSLRNAELADKAGRFKNIDQANPLSIGDVFGFQSPGAFVGRQLSTQATTAPQPTAAPRALVPQNEMIQNQQLKELQEMNANIGAISTADF